MEKTETQPEEFRVSAAGAELFVRKQGRGPGLLLIHGVACDCDYFTETARCLKQQFTVLTYDRRGYSRSHLLYTGNADGAEAAGYVPEQQTPRVQGGGRGGSDPGIRAAERLCGRKQRRGRGGRRAGADAPGAGDRSVFA